MDTNTSILYNSPALHALKRDQLLGLCKIHGVKASGKNADIVRRLKFHARTMQLDDASGDSDSDDNLTAANPAVPRVSEAWELMDTIEETDERSNKGSLTSLRTAGNMTTGEFGSSNSKGSVGSSLKAIASSFGMRRGGASNNNTATTASGQSIFPGGSMLGDTFKTHSTAMTTPDVSPGPAIADDDDHMASPLPGTSLRPGAPAPSENARLSMGTGSGGAGPSTTIRMISSTAPPASTLYASPPKLRPFTTTFDLDTSMTSPARVWPQPQPATSSIYPSLPTVQVDDDTDMPGAFDASPAPAKRMDVQMLSPPRPEPFVFGQPRHSLSNAEFAAGANSVLTEMNRRLVAQGGAPVTVPLPDLLARGRNALANGGAPEIPDSPTHASPDRFERVHQAQFAKMESIVDVVARREAAARSLAPPPAAGRKRKSEAAELTEGPGPIIKRKSIAPIPRRNAIPGALFADDDDDEEPVNRRMSKRPRVSIKDNGASSETEEDPVAQRERLAREREAIQRKLAASRARRRSSRVSGVGARPRVSIAKPPPPKPRFGFFSSAKTLVKNVWNRGSAAPATSKPVVTAPKAAAATTEPKKLTKPAPAPAPAPKSAAPVPKPPATRPSVAGPSSSKPRQSVAIGSGASRKLVTPSLVPNGPVGSKGMGTGVSRTSVASGSSNVSSLGARSNLPIRSPAASPANTTNKRVSTLANAALGHKRMSSTDSTGTNRSLNTLGTAASGHKRTTSTDSTGTKRSSTLFAPTAASLARQVSSGSRPLPTPPVPSATSKASVLARNTVPSIASVLSPVTNTNNPRSAVFSRPLTAAMSPTRIPSPTRPAFSSENVPIFANIPKTVPMKAPGPIPAPIAGTSTLAPRKAAPVRPRISRSKVLAKVNAQRAAGASGPGSEAGTSTLAPKPAGAAARKSTGRVRSSLGASGARRSLGAAKAPRSSVANVEQAAKRRSRQSEYARRKSAAAPQGNAMEV